jgi:hypothetical protein
MPAKASDLMMVERSGVLHRAPISDVLGLLALSRRHAWHAPYSYCGVAPPGADTNALVWSITRIEIDDAGDVVETMTASGAAWENYLTEEYS